ncbi:MAG: nitroreductase [Candidatus Woesearchaeota archaeon]|nr:nitroreductase [Candidatus Woesearchaeota archaeon]
MSNEVIKAIKERRAVRRYKNKEIPENIINEIIEAGRYAPSAMNRQPWKFIAITNKALIKDLSNVLTKKILPTSPLTRERMKTMEDPLFYSAPVLIFLLATEHSGWSYADCGICSQNMMLAAYSLGIASCFIGMAKHIEGEKILKKLNIPEGYKVINAVVFGYADEKPELKERKKDNVYWIR